MAPTSRLPHRPDATRRNPTATTITVTIAALNGIAAQAASISCIAIHN